MSEVWWKTREYRIWSGIVRRCTNPNCSQYDDYGGRGITICEEWRSDPRAFIAYIGTRPSNDHQVERIDNDRGYEPGNVRWATRKEQTRNTRRNRNITAFGRTACLSEWAEITGVPLATIHSRIVRLGWDAERALSTPQRGKIAKSKLSDDDIREIRQRAAAGESGASIARSLGICRSSACRIISGSSFGWIE